MSEAIAPPAEQTSSGLVPALNFIALVAAVVGSLAGAPLITAVATGFGVEPSSAQWTLTISLLVGAVATPVLGRLGSGPHRRRVILATLGAGAVGSLLTVVAPSFPWLLAGRAAQGLGLGLTSLLMGVARDHLPAERATRAIASLSVASTIGVGIGYPLAGYLTDLAGLRAVYGLGLVLALATLAAAWPAIPEAPQGRAGQVDAVGAALLGLGLSAFLLAISQTALWASYQPWMVALAVLAGLALVAWGWWERRAPSPLVDLSLLRHPAVAGANLVMFLGGIGMYLLLTLVVRYMQAPAWTGYGFGASGLVAGLVLVPFSVLGFVGGQLTPRLRQQASAQAVLGGGAGAVLVAFVFFALARAQLWEPFAVMALLGLGVGTFSAAMPGAILAVTPASETSSAMSFNQVVRSGGFSIGSALGGLILAAATPAGQRFPTDAGYGLAAWIGAGAIALTIGLIIVSSFKKVAT